MRSGRIRVRVDSRLPTAVRASFERNESFAGVLDIQADELEYAGVSIKAEGEPSTVALYRGAREFRQDFIRGPLLDDIVVSRMHAGNGGVSMLLVCITDEDPPDDAEWTGKHWMKRNFLVPTFVFPSFEEAAAFHLRCAVSARNINVLDRPVVRDQDSSGTVCLYRAVYGLGRDEAAALAERFPKVADLVFSMKTGRTWLESKDFYSTKKEWMEGRWWHGIIGEKRANEMEAMFLDGQPMPRARRKRNVEQD